MRDTIRASLQQPHLNTTKLIVLLCVCGLVTACASSTLEGNNTDAKDTHSATDTTTDDAPDDSTATTDPDATSSGTDALTSDDISDSTTAPDTADTSGGTSGACVPNRDGQITRSEVTIASGLRGNFKIADNATINLTPVDGVWDLTEALDAGKDITAHLYDPAGEWFAEFFPDATYFTQLAEGSDLQGIFRATDDALELIGVASPQDSATATRVAYDPPVQVLKFPLKVGESWSVETTVSGNFNGFPISYTETYASTVDMAGTLKIPFARGQGMEVLRVSTAMERGVWTFIFPYYYTTNIKTVAFVSECFGTVASATSQEDEASTEFTDAAEVRGLAP